MKSDRPQYFLTYLCTQCAMESGFYDLDVVRCRYCDEPTEMQLVSKEVITPELVTAHLKASADRMLEALHGAYEALQKENLPSDSEDELQLLDIMARAKKFRDEVHGFVSNHPEDETE